MTNLSKYPIATPDLTYWMGERGYNREILEKQYANVMQHVEAVQEAGEKLGVSAEQLEVHDLSKFSREEFGGYAMHFQGGGAPQEFARAWLHHIHHNPHHWQYWIFPDGYTPKDTNIQSGVVEMPSNYALEMIADWMGASMVYAHTDDMTQWLKGTISKITLHMNTASYVRARLNELGYDFVYDLRFKHELARQDATN